MPRGDRTGPAGAGPMSGRGLGYCAGYPAPGHATPGYGHGRGVGGHGGRGWRHRHYAYGGPGWGRGVPAPYYGPPVEYAPTPPPTRRDELAALRAESEYLAAALEDTKARLAELESSKDE